jgi:hypothetical protein
VRWSNVCRNQAACSGEIVTRGFLLLGRSWPSVLG